MDLDLETFLTALYVTVDDLYQSHIRPQMPPSGGPPARMSDSEVLCLGLAAQWRSGVPWKSERGVLRYVRKHFRHLFPGLLSQRAFNRRMRRRICIKRLGPTNEEEHHDETPSTSGLTTFKFRVPCFAIV